MQENMNSGNDAMFSDAAFADEIATAKPSMYKVMLINDDFTPVEFVISIMQKFFHRSYEDSVSATMQVHNEGVAVCGYFTRDMAETKVGMVNEFASRNQHPLKCTFEEDL